MKLGGNQLVPYFADMLGAVLPCISDKEEKIKMVGFLSFLQLHSSIDFFCFLDTGPDYVLSFGEWSGCP